MRTRFPVPANEDDFEILCLHLFRHAWQCFTLQRNGRRGQRQHGVDIFGAQEGRILAIQCKLRTGSLPIEEILSEVAKARSFTPTISHYVVATTSRRDTKLQRDILALSISHERRKFFSIEVVSWDDIEELLYLHPKAQVFFDVSAENTAAAIEGMEGRIYDKLQAVADQLVQQYQIHNASAHQSILPTASEIEDLRSQLRDALGRVEELAGRARSQDAIETARKHGDTSKLLELLFEERSKRSSEYSEINFEIAAVARIQGKKDTEIAALREIVGLHPDNLEIWSRLGRAYAENGNLTEAVEVFERLAEAGRATGSPMVISNAKMNQALAYRSYGKLDAAFACLNDALPIVENLSGSSLVRCLREIGIVYHLRGDFLQARAYYTRAFKLAAVGHPDETIDIIVALANLECEHGQFENALKLYRGMRRVSTPDSKALIAGNMAGILAALGQPKRAEKLYWYALRRDQSAGNIGETARHFQGLANLRYSERAFAEAERLLKEASDVCHRTGDTITLATVYGSLAEVLLAEAVYHTHDYDRALHVAEEAVSLAESQGSISQVARYRISVGRALMMKGSFREAAALLEASALKFAELKVPHLEALAREMLSECHRILKLINDRVGGQGQSYA